MHAFPKPTKGFLESQAPTLRSSFPSLDRAKEGPGASCSFARRLTTALDGTAARLLVTGLGISAGPVGRSASLNLSLTEWRSADEGGRGGRDVREDRLDDDVLVVAVKDRVELLLGRALEEALRSLGAEDVEGCERDEVRLGARRWGARRGTYSRRC